MCNIYFPENNFVKIFANNILLYYKTGKILSEKIAAEKGGVKIVEQIAEDLQKQLPGLRGFSYRNLMNMRKFYIEYQNFTFLQSPTAQLRKARKKDIAELSIQRRLVPSSRQITKQL
jgi:hypothetical protein